MKVLLINDYATLSGGAEIGTRILHDGLRQRGHDARIFASDAAAPGSENFADYTCRGTLSSWRTALQTANPWAPRRLRAVLREFDPDVVHVRMFLTQLSPLILPLLRDRPSLCHIVWYRPICPIGTKLLPDGNACESPPGAVCWRRGCLPARDWPLLMGQLKLWRRRRGAFDLFVANSHAVSRRLIDEGIAPVEVVWNGVPTRPPRPPLADPPTVAFAARLVRDKGPTVLLHAMAQVVRQLPGARLLLAGQGPQQQSLRALIAELGISQNVSLLGQLSRDDLEREFDAAWVQAVPSIWPEPFGFVAAEAMMRGAAVIASDIGGLPEIVRHQQTGLLVAPNDPNALAQALAQLLGDRRKAEAMGAAARRVALEYFQQQHFVDRFVALYEKLCNYPHLNKPRSEPVAVDR